MSSIRPCFNASIASLASSRSLPSRIRLSPVAQRHQHSSQTEQSQPEQPATEQQSPHAIGYTYRPLQNVHNTETPPSRLSSGEPPNVSIRRPSKGLVRSVVHSTPTAKVFVPSQNSRPDRLDPSLQPGVREPSSRYFEHFIRPPLPIPAPAGQWLQKVELGPLLEQLPPELRADPLSVLEQFETSQRRVTTCLEAFLAQTRAESQSLEAIQHTLQSVRAGARLMSWLQLQPPGSLSLLGSSPLTRAMIYLWSASEHDSYLRRLYEAEGMWGAHITKVEDYHWWRNECLQHIVEAKTFWWGGDLNRGLATFLDWGKFTMRSLTVQPGSHGLYVPGRWLVSQLVPKTTKGLDAETYDRFVDNARLWNIGRPESELHDTIKLMSIHPTRPDPLARLQYWKDNEDPRRRSQHVGQMISRWAPSIYLSLRETAQVLWEHDYKDGALWIAQFAEQEFPELYNRDHIYHKDRDLKKRKLAAAATSFLSLKTGKVYHRERTDAHMVEIA